MGNVDFYEFEIDNNRIYSPTMVYEFGPENDQATIFFDLQVPNSLDGTLVNYIEIKMREKP